MRVPTWVTLKNVPDEFLNVTSEIASGLGLVLGVDKRNEHMRDQRFCIGLLSGSGWRTHIAVDNEAKGEETLIAIDYGNLPIRCHICLSTKHLARDCPGLSSKGGETKAGYSSDNPDKAIRAEEKSTVPAVAALSELPGPPPLISGQHPIHFQAAAPATASGAGSNGRSQ